MAGIATDNLYGTRTIKRQRRIRAVMDALPQRIFAVVEEQHPMMVRQVYYRMVAAGVIEKTQAEYRAIQRQVLLLRRAKAIPYSWITDNTRYVLRPRYMFLTLKDALQRTIDFYRRDMWADTVSCVEFGPRVTPWPAF
jgi:hypothetical protein